MKSCRGLMIAMPAVVSSALLRRISAGRPRAQAQIGSGEAAERLRKRLLGCHFHFDLQLSLTAPSARALSELSPGKLLVMKQPADGLAKLVSEGQPILQARIARLGNTRAAQVIAPSKETFSGREYDGKPC